MNVTHTDYITSYRRWILLWRLQLHSEIPGECQNFQHVQWWEVRWAQHQKRTSDLSIMWGCLHCIGSRTATWSQEMDRWQINYAKQRQEKIHVHWTRGHPLKFLQNGHKQQVWHLQRPAKCSNDSTQHRSEIMANQNLPKNNFCISFFTVLFSRKRTEFLG